MNLPQFLIESINGQLINFNAKLDKDDNFYPDSKLLVDFVNFLNTKYDFASFIAIED